MASNNEKLCYAIVCNSDVANTNWPKVSSDLGINSGAAQKRWSRFKATKAAEAAAAGGLAAAAAGPAAPKAAAKKRVAGKKRGAEEINDGEEDEVSQAPAGKTKATKVTKAKVEAEAEEDVVKEAGEEAQAEDEVVKEEESVVADVSATKA